MDDQPSNALHWVLGGCGLLGLLGLCVAGVGAVFYLRGTEQGTSAAPPVPVSDPVPSVPDPSPTPTPIPTPPPLPEPVPPAVVDPSTRRIVATVERVSGRGLPVTVGAECAFNVERRERDDGGPYWCNAQIVCAGALVYGGRTGGYFPCELRDGPGRHVIGSDRRRTSGDRDPAMELDTVRGTLRIEDDDRGAFGRFSLEAHISSVQ